MIDPQQKELELEKKAVPLVSIVILNYNTFQLTLECIASIKKYTSDSVPLEFIVVDNASANNEGLLLEKELHKEKDCLVVHSLINLGFGAGNLLGAQRAKGKYFAFINSDVLFVENCFPQMIGFMQDNEDVGACGIQILDANREKTISHRPFEGIRYKLFGKKFLYLTDPSIPKIDETLNSPTPVDFVIGSFMFFDADAYRSCGGFDPNIFLYYEESDICHRLKKLGYRTVFLPYLSYVHLEGQSGAFSIAKKKEHLLSYLYVLRKNYGYPKFWLIKNYLLVSYFFKSIVKSKYRPLFNFLFLRGESLAHSMRHTQKQHERNS